MIGKLERVALREVWKHEALDFTPWLEESLDVLNDVIDVTLSGAEREQSAGTFNVDLVAEGEAGNPAVIENQLAHRKLDHAVLDAYRWPHDLIDEEILSRLLALNLDRAKQSSRLQGSEQGGKMPPLPEGST